LYRLLGSHSSELTAAALTAAAGLCWLSNRNYGLAVAMMGFSAVAALYWTPSPITQGEWYTYSDNTRRFVATIPELHNTPGLITLVFSASCILAGLVIFRRKLTFCELGGAILLLPLAIDIGGCFGGYWYPLGPRMFEFWPWLVLTSAGVGSTSLAWSVLRRTRPRIA
jgi:hypothetical protein